MSLRLEALTASKEMIVSVGTIEFSLFGLVPIVNCLFFRNKNTIIENEGIVLKLFLEILIRVFDNQKWSQQNIEAVYENQRNILTHKISGL